jgi:hypothetical protein
MLRTDPLCCMWAGEAVLSIANGTFVWDLEKVSSHSLTLYATS